MLLDNNKNKTIDHVLGLCLIWIRSFILVKQFRRFIISDI